MQQRQPGSPQIHTVRDPRQARVLLDRATFSYLSPFLGRPRSASQAAAELSVGLDRVLSRIRRFTDLGLLVIDHEQPRRGRAVRFYRTVADEFFITVEFVPDLGPGLRTQAYWHTLLLRGLEEAFTAGLSRHPDSGARLHRRTDDGAVVLELASGPGTPADSTLEKAIPVHVGWEVLHLDRPDVVALATALTQLASRYRGRQATNGRPYVVGLQVAPLPADAIVPEAPDDRRSPHTGAPASGRDAGSNPADL